MFVVVDGGGGGDVVEVSYTTYTSRHIYIYTTTTRYL